MLILFVVLIVIVVVGSLILLLGLILSAGLVDMGCVLADFGLGGELSFLYWLRVGLDDEL